MKLKRWDNSEVVFEYGCEMVKELVEQAVVSKISLYRADLGGVNLEGADLGGADLEGTDLEGANLWCVNLEGANLEGADLRGVNLEGANLWGANLVGANLEGANLEGAVGNQKEVRSMQLETYPVTFTKDVLQVGCKRFTIEKWKQFSDQDIESMDSEALAFWVKWKTHIFSTIDMCFLGVTETNSDTEKQKD